MSIFIPGKKVTCWLRPSKSVGCSVTGKGRMRRYYSREGMLVCKRCGGQTANLGRVCVGCLGRVLPLKGDGTCDGPRIVP